MADGSTDVTKVQLGEPVGLLGYLQECGPWKATASSPRSSPGWVATPESWTAEALCVPCRQAARSESDPSPLNSPHCLGKESCVRLAEF